MWDDPLGDLRRFVASCEDRYRNHPPPRVPPPADATPQELWTWLCTGGKGFDQPKLTPPAEPPKPNRAQRRAQTMRPR